MQKRNKIVITVLISTLMLSLAHFAYRETMQLKRDSTVLMNEYYLFQKTKPKAAKKALEIILKQDENHLPALKELSAITLQEKNYQQAIPLLERLHQLKPDNVNYLSQLAYSYYDLGNWQKANQYFNELKQQKNARLKIDAQLMLNSMHSYIPYYRNYSQVEMPEENIEFKESTVVSIFQDLFYKIHDKEPENARSLLALLFKLSSDKPTINQELGYQALQNKNNTEALYYFSLAYQEAPTAHLALQLGYLYALEKKNEEAASYFLLASLSSDHELRAQALKSYGVVTYLPSTETKPGAEGAGGTATREMLLMDQYYALKKINKKAAWVLIKEIIKEYPDNVQALKEGGFLAIEQKSLADAVAFFKHAYELTYQADLAMQLGYLYGQEGNNYLSYQYFKFATNTQDKELELRAQNAMTNLAGLQTKFLPSPYFSEIFFTPFKQTRFDLTVRPIIARFGVELNNSTQAKAYAVFRQTDDNKTDNAGQIPQVYEDNVRLIGVGFLMMPIPKFPMTAYVEASGAYDLVYRDRARWRGDLRAGLMYYNELGARPAYFDKLTFSSKYYCTLYADSTYFSRFNNNVITTLKTNQGIRLFQYHSSMVNLYVTGRTLFDTNRDFFNNIAEVGPGISFTPSNRFNVQLRFERINGVYLPVRNSSNPYPKYYTNRTFQLLFYVKM